MFLLEVSLLLRYKMKFGQNGVKKTCFHLALPLTFCYICCRIITQQYPRKVCFNLFGDKVDQYPAAIGEDVVVSFDLESREFNGRWYTDVRAWKIEKSASVARGVPDMPPMPNDIAPFPPAPAVPDLAPSPTDDLPF